MIAFAVETSARTYRNVSAEEKGDAAETVAKWAYGRDARVRFVANHPKSRRGASTFAVIVGGREVDVLAVTYY
jgi:hypothetical protein